MKSKFWADDLRTKRKVYDEFEFDHVEDRPLTTFQQEQLLKRTAADAKALAMSIIRERAAIR